MSITKISMMTGKATENLRRRAPWLGAAPPGSTVGPPGRDEGHQLGTPQIAFIHGVRGKILTTPNHSALKTPSSAGVKTGSHIR